MKEEGRAHVDEKDQPTAEFDVGSAPSCLRPPTAGSGGQQLGD